MRKRTRKDMDATGEEDSPPNRTLMGDHRSSIDSSTTSESSKAIKAESMTDTNSVGSDEQDMKFDSKGRTRLACARCRKRKTKCSGTIPCKSCITGGYDCQFYRRPKKITVMDTEIENYQFKIEELERELRTLKENAAGGARARNETESHADKYTSRSLNSAVESLSSSPTPKPNSGNEVHHNVSRIGDSLRSIVSGKHERLNLSIWLGSASSELICWNLKQFKISSADKNKTTEDIIISPNFSSFHEETAYDYLFQFDEENDVLNEEQVFSSLTYGKVITLVDNVVTFINAGYLTIEPKDFREKCGSYFNLSSPEQEFSRDKIDFSDQKTKYFLLKLLILLALGEVYGENSFVGAKPSEAGLPKNFPGLGKHTRTNNGRTHLLDHVLNLDTNRYDNTENGHKYHPPGMEYFKVVLRNFPSPLILLTLRTKKLDETFEIIELFGLIALYLRIIDKKNAAVVFTLIALQLCISLNLHKEKHLRSIEINNMDPSYIDKIWWGTFCLNRFLSSRIGQPLLLSLEEIREIDLKNPDSKNTEESKGSTPEIPSSKYEFASLSSMKYYIELARISDKVNSELYCLKMPFDNKVYFQSILSITEALLAWAKSLPNHLKLKLPMVLSKSSEENRLICSLHLNYLHHIYLTSIPVLLNFVKMKIINYYKFGRLVLNPMRVNELPKNMANLMRMLINSCQLTINIFMTLYKQKYLRIFGITDLDFLFSSSLVFLICLILGVDQDRFYPFKEYLEVTMSLMDEVSTGGNLVARGKLDQILDLLWELEELLLILNHESLFDLSKKFAGTREGKSGIQSIYKKPSQSVSKTNHQHLTSVTGIGTITQGLQSEHLGAIGASNGIPLTSTFNIGPINAGNGKAYSHAREEVLDPTIIENRGIPSITIPPEGNTMYSPIPPIIPRLDQYSEEPTIAEIYVQNQQHTRDFEDAAFMNDHQLYDSNLNIADEDIEFMDSILQGFDSG